MGHMTCWVGEACDFEHERLVCVCFRKKGVITGVKRDKIFFLSVHRCQLQKVIIEWGRAGAWGRYLIAVGGVISRT